MCAQIAPIDIPKSYRLLNVGGTTLISAKHNGKVDVMAATWACPLDFNAVSVVIGGNRYTRKLINESGVTLQFNYQQLVSWIKLWK